MARVELWTAPRIWPDNECYILGGGYSLRHVNLELLRDKRVIAVNNAYELGNWDVVFFGDCAWLMYRNSRNVMHQQALLQWAGLKVTCCENDQPKPGIKTLKRRNSPYGIDNNPSKVAWNRSSGAAAINLAVHFGVKKIVLLGFDMQKTEDEHNWHRNHPHQNSKTFDPYPRHLVVFTDIARDLEKLGVLCINATPGSLIEAFPIMTLEDAIGVTNSR